MEKRIQISMDINRIHKKKSVSIYICRGIFKLVVEKYIFYTISNDERKGEIR